MKREELDKLTSDYVEAPSDEKERVLKDTFRVCLDLMSRTAGKIKSSGLNVGIYDKRWFEIYPIDNEDYNVDFNILPSESLFFINKD